MEIDKIRPEEYMTLVDILRRVTGCSLGGTKSVREYSNVTMSTVMSVGPTDNVLCLPNRLSYISSESESYITSYGCIMRSKSGSYLCVKRRDSVDYVEIIRGSYKISNLPILVSGLTPEERKRLLANDFESLWTDISGILPEGDSYEFAVKSFTSIREYLRQLIDLIEVHPLAGKNLWLFPKGRQNYTDGVLEDPYECAIREFTEETGGMSTNRCKILNRVFEERFIASNGKRYKTVFYIFISEDLTSVNPIIGPKTPIRDSPIAETKKVAWLSKNDIRNLMIPRRIRLTDEIEKTIP